jgi:hypothetical protein
MEEKVRQRKFATRNKKIFRNKIGDEIGLLKIVDYVEGKYGDRIFQCNYCGKHFQAQTQNVKRGWVWNCGCIKNSIETIKTTGRLEFEYRGII